MTDAGNTNRNFKGQYKDEEVLVFCRRHWIVLGPHIAGILVVTVGVLIFILSYNSSVVETLLGSDILEWLLFIATVGITYYFHYFFNKVFSFYLQTILITTHRVVRLDQTIFFRHARDSIDLRDIRDIEVSKTGVMKTLFNYGEIRILVSSSEEARVYQFVPNPTYYFQKINKTRTEFLKNAT